MTPEDQATRGAERCETHPGTSSVARCDGCGRALCLRCAVPVRGRVFGPECLADVLGPDGAVGPRPVPRPPRDRRLALAGLGFLVAAAGSVLPWTRFGVGSGIFGGWGVGHPRWSTLATGAALVGLVVVTVMVARFSRLRPLGAALLTVLAAAGGVGAVLHMLNPPPFTQAWLGPWVALAGSAAVLGAMGWMVRNGPSQRESSIP